MQSNQLLQADLLDIIFNDRNKLYGAYELRRNYSKRILKAMGIAAIVVGTLLSLAFIKPIKNDSPGIPTIADSIQITIVTLPEEKPIIPEPQRMQVQQAAGRTVDYVEPVIVENTEHVMTEQSELSDAIISDKTEDGPPAVNAPVTEVKGNGGELTPTPVVEEEIYTAPQVAAMYEGDWIKYLNRNLNAQVPTDHDAPAGSYRILIQFVVDVDGTISNIVPLTKLGYGMEQEAIRVIKKSMKWRPASQNHKAVKAYRTQPITFQVITE